MEERRMTEPEAAEAIDEPLVTGETVQQTPFTFDDLVEVIRMTALESGRDSPKRADEIITIATYLWPKIKWPEIESPWSLSDEGIRLLAEMAKEMFTDEPQPERFRIDIQPAANYF